MDQTAEIEKQLSSLSPQDRERIALAAWESLEDEPGFAADSQTDPEGIATAMRREKELETGSVKAIDHAEFKRRASGDG
jgi:hypothetical protein